MAKLDPIPTLPKVPKVSRSRGLGAMVENSLVRFAVEVFNRIKDGLSGLIRHGLEAFLESIEKPLVEMGGPIIDDVLQSPALPDSVRYALSRTRSGSDQAAVVGLIGAIVTVVFMLVPAALSGVTMKVRQFSFFVTRPFLMGFSTWYAAVLRDKGLRDLMTQDLQGQGWTDEQIAAARLAAEMRLGVQDVFRANIRGVIGDPEMSRRLGELGVNPADAGILQQLTELVPGPQDLVRFALREAWRDDVAAKYGYDADYVPEFGEWMEKQGYSADWARLYWRSHWLVPSVGQAFEMLHRDVIGDKELDDLLKVQDIPSGWRNKLKQIAYTPLGRIDTRWAFEENKIGRDEVKSRFEAQGYSPDDAELMTEITVSKAVAVSKGLTRAAVEKAYKKRRLERGEAKEMLGDLGIQAEIAEFYLDQVDHDLSEGILDTRIAAVAKMYTNGQIDENGVFDRLGALGLASPEIEANIELWSVNRSSTVRRPSRSNLDNFFLQGIIGLDEYRKRMRDLEYPDPDISLYVAALAMEREQDAQETERKTRDAQDKIRASRVKTTYQIEKARIDTSIAELQEAIATAQVAVVAEDGKRDLALSSVLSVEQIAAVEREYKPLLRAVDLAIAESRLSIAGLQSQIGAIEQTISEDKRSLAIGRNVAAQEKLTTERLTLDTLRARLATLIAGLQVSIREKKVEVFTFEDAAEKDAMKATIAVLDLEIAKRQKEQAEARERQEQIDALLQVTYTLEERALIAVEIATSQALIAELNAQSDEMRQVIREAQLERGKVSREMEARIGALPGKVEQVRIRAQSDAYTDDLRSTIAALRSNIASLRLEKSGLSVGYREASQ